MDISGLLEKKKRYEAIKDSIPEATRISLENVFEGDQWTVIVKAEDAPGGVFRLSSRMGLSIIGGMAV